MILPQPARAESPSLRFALTTLKCPGDVSGPAVTDPADASPTKPPRTAVFLRAANVGGNNVFRPKDFCQAHPELALTNIGAAGTFVSRAPLDAARLEDALRAALPVKVAMAIVPHEQILQLVNAGPWPCPSGAKQEVTVLLGPRLRDELDWPDEPEIVLASDHGWCIVTNRMPGGKLTPYKVVEAASGVAGTTRSWGIMERVSRA